MSSEQHRVAVSTYVPAHQRDRWAEHAEALDMSLSEFVRTMVQAGRRGFDLGDSDGGPEEVGSPGSNPRGDGLKTVVLEVLREEGRLGWSELVDSVAGDVEQDIESALLELQEAGQVRHSPREGTYAVVEAGDGD